MREGFFLFRGPAPAKRRASANRHVFSIEVWAMDRGLIAADVRCSSTVKVSRNGRFGTGLSRGLHRADVRYRADRALLVLDFSGQCQWSLPPEL
jgi:hypothetical protein